MVNPNRHWYESKPMRLVECEDCRLVYADPRPKFEELLKRTFMHMDGWAKEITHRKLGRPNVEEVHRRIVVQALNYCWNASSLFDVGTGAGTVLTEARKLGLSVAGNDVNMYACHFLKQKGISVYNTPTNKLELTDKFDIVTMLDYLEHTYTPFDDLKWAWNHLNDQGILLLKTLYLNCPNHKVQGDNWKLFEAGHFQFFYTGVLLQMFKKSSFEILFHERGSAIIKVIARKK